MYVLIVDYIKSDNEVAPYVETHRSWVKLQLNNNIFYAAGPKNNGLGGVILARAINRAELNTIIASDPYVLEDVAEYRVIEFSCAATIEQLHYLQTL